MISAQFWAKWANLPPTICLEKAGAVETELQCFLEAKAPPREGPPPLPLELEPREDVPLLGGLGAGKKKSFLGVS